MPGARKHLRGQQRGEWIHSALILGLLILLLPLSDSRCMNPGEEYRRVSQLFINGYLEKSEREAERDYAQFSYSDPEWANRFRLLAAEAMVWRGTYRDALSLLGEARPRAISTDDEIRGLSTEAVALLRVQQPAAAEGKLQEAEKRCAGTLSASCGGVLRTRGVFAAARGNLSEARRYFLASLAFSRADHDQLLETTGLLNLSYIALQREHYDEALEWSRQAYDRATQIDANDLLEVLSGNLGWTFFRLGDAERAQGLFFEAQKRAADLGDIREEVKWLTTSGYVYQESGDLTSADERYRRALTLASMTDGKEDVLTSLECLAHVSIAMGQLNQAERYIRQAEPLIRANGNHLDALDIKLAQAGLMAARGDQRGAEELFRSVVSDPGSQTSMRLGAEHQLAKVYEGEGRLDEARAEYETALQTFESERAQLKNENSKLPFFANATPIYDDYIRLLVAQGKTREALEAADQSRARTLEQGLGVTAADSLHAEALRPEALAGREDATLLFYWLGEKQSYLWAVRRSATKVYTLPPKSEIARQAARYQEVLEGPIDPLEPPDETGLALFDMLVEPAREMLPAGGRVIVLCDGALSRLNFETLLVPGAHPHYWIEDANVISAPSLRMLAAARPESGGGGKLLLVGHAVSPGPDYPELPHAAMEMRQVRRHFAAGDATVLTGEQATSAAYLASHPERFSYIDFVAHGVASRTDPLDSAIILSRTGDGEDSFKLYAREIIGHPIDARLVVISACYGNGDRAYAGEGLVGLSWAFLRAGAHNVIGALWEVSDDSTPRLMDKLYEALEEGLAPSVALRQAQLDLLHAHDGFSRPFYWAPFQFYTGL